MSAQPWIHSARVDGALILGPAIGASALALALSWSGRAHADVSTWAWLALVVGIDVAHVYATLFRTYLDPQERARLAPWLTGVPMLAWLAGVLLYSLGAAAFWTALAYTAVFHFVRQQYGFLMLYARRERGLPRWCRLVDQVAIYGATIFPLLYWHTHLPRPFVWFMDGDFLALPGWLWPLAAPLYLALAAVYVAKEAWLLRSHRTFNVPRNAIVSGTALSWYVGIVMGGGDLVFTLTNVVAHGVPYLGLSFIYAARRGAQRRRLAAWFDWRWLALGIGLLLLLAFVEEGLWDGLVWREHLALFPGFALLPQLDGTRILSLVVPLLALPQMTHYVLDGVIWRLRAHPEWRTTLFWHGPVAPPPATPAALQAALRG